MEKRLSGFVKTGNESQPIRVIKGMGPRFNCSHRYSNGNTWVLRDRNGPVLDAEGNEQRVCRDCRPVPDSVGTPMLVMGLSEMAPLRVGHEDED